MVTSTAQALLEELRRRGARLQVVEPDNLTAYISRDAVADLNEMVGLYKEDIIALLRHEQAELQWRIDAMRSEVPSRGPIPFLVARSGVLGTDAPGHCLSCGDALSKGEHYRCSPCILAVQEVLRSRG